MAEIRDIKFDITAQDKTEAAFKSVTGKLKSMNGDFNNMISMVKGPFMALTATITAVAGSFALLKDAVSVTQKLGQEVATLQRMTGMTAESASEMIAVADQMGVSYDTLQTGLTAVARKMGGLKEIQDATVDASGAMVDVFERYNIQVKNTDGSTKALDEVFGQIKTRIQSAGSETEKLTMATQFFKGSAVDMLKILNLTDAEYKQIAADAKKYGLILTQDNVDAVKKYTMAQRDLDDVLQGFKLAIGNELMPFITQLITNLITMGEVIMPIVKGLLDLTVGVMKASEALHFFGRSIVQGFLGFSDAASASWNRMLDVMNGTTEASAKSKAGIDAHASAQASAAEMAKKHEEALKKTVKAYEEMSKIYEKVGEERLKFSGEEYKNALASESATLTTMQTALEKYEQTIGQTYKTRIDGEKAIAAAMKWAGKPEDIAKQQAVIMQVEQQSAVARLGMWSQYYASLETQYKASVTAILAASDQIRAQEKAAQDDWMGYQDMITKLRQEGMTASQKYYDQVNANQEKFNLALSLEGEERISALKAYQQSMMSTVGEVKEGDQIIVSSGQTVVTANNAINEAQLEIMATREKMKQKAQTAMEAEVQKVGAINEAMGKAKEMMELYRTSITETDALLNQQRILSIDATGAMREVQIVKDQLASIPDVTYKQVVVQYYTQASPIMPFTEGMNRINAMMSSLPTGGEYTMQFGSLANDWQRYSKGAAELKSYQFGSLNGLSYEGIKQQSEYEGKANNLWGQIENLFKASQSSGGGTTVNYAPQITVQSGSGSTGQSLAKEIDTQMADDIRMDRSKSFVEIKRKLGVN